MCIRGCFDRDGELVRSGFTSLKVNHENTNEYEEHEEDDNKTRNTRKIRKTEDMKNTKQHENFERKKGFLRDLSRTSCFRGCIRDRGTMIERDRYHVATAMTTC